MPAERKYTAGSIIYFDHEVGDGIFILKSGQMDLSYIQPESGEKITKELAQGEFFGLKSAIIGHTRDEVAEAVSEVLTIEFKIPEFEAYVSKNVELMKRLLRVLSNQLRNLGIKVNNYLGNNVLYSPNIGLFKIGEYYILNKQYRQAIQVYERYIQQYGDTNIVEEAKYRIQICEEAIRTGFIKDFKSIDVILGGEDTQNLTAVADTKDSMANAHSVLGVRECMDKYYKAEGYVKGQDFANAEIALKELFTLDTSKFNPDLMNQAKYMYVTTLYQLKKYNECSQLVAELLKNIKEPLLIKKILLVLADIYKSLGNLEGEKSILQKIVIMPPIDMLSKAAKERMQKLG